MNKFGMKEVGVEGKEGENIKEEGRRNGLYKYISRLYIRREELGKE